MRVLEYAFSWAHCFRLLPNTTYIHAEKRYAYDVIDVRIVYVARSYLAVRKIHYHNNNFATTSLFSVHIVNPNLCGATCE